MSSLVVKENHTFDSTYVGQFKRGGLSLVTYYFKNVCTNLSFSIGGSHA